MDIQIQKSVLENAILKSQSFLSKDGTDITSQIRLSANDGELLVNATDYEMGVSMIVDNLFIVDDGEVIVSGSKLISSVKALKQGEIKIKKDKDNLIISQSRSKFKLPLFASVDFPSFPKNEGLDKISINSATMIDSFRKITPSIDTNNPKFELNGALIKVNNSNVEFVSTDTRRLSIVEIENKSDNELSLIVPKKAIVEMQKLFYDDVEISYDESTLIIETGNISFFTKLINGKFPDFERIIPSEFSTNINIQKVPFIECVKQIMTVSENVRVTIKSDIIEFDSLSDDNSKANTALECDNDIDDDLSICVISKYLLDFLNIIVDGDFTLKANDENMPFVLESDDLKTIIMPIVL